MYMLHNIGYIKYCSWNSSIKRRKMINCPGRRHILFTIFKRSKALIKLQPKLYEQLLRRTFKHLIN